MRDGVIVNGELRLRLRAVGGETRVIESYAHAPFHYFPPARGEPPLLTIVNSSGGILGGDRLEMTVALDAGARLTLRTQAATKVYRSAGAPAVAVSRFILGAGAFLDYFPDEIIPFAGSDYEQITGVEIGDGAVALLTEIVTAGRLARAERFAFSRLCIDVQCAHAETVLLRDRADLRPNTAAGLASVATLGDDTVWGSLYLMTAVPIDAAAIERVDAALGAVDEGVGAASATACGLAGRVVGTSVDTVRAALLNAHATAREYVTERRSA